MPRTDPPLGLIAGAGELPLLVATGARRAGRRLSVVALRGWAEPSLRDLAERFAWRGVAQLGGWIRTLRAAGCREVMMVGRVRKADMFSMPRWRQWLMYIPDLTSLRVWYFRTADKRNDSLLRAVADELQARGITMIDSTRYATEALAEERVLTNFAPPTRVCDDAEFAWPIARQLGALDIGQSVAVKEREIIAVEAIEGTDALIERAGLLCRAGGWTLVKLAKPNQDMRFDVPTIGPQTIENLHRAGGAGIVVEAGKTFILDKPRTIELANQYRIALIGRGS
ncbi:MAG: UDP-2,3-diacylglucosamine diphosphatase LpxI [Phycisphaerales bacterium]|nr:UDP-2,3-diacylglucosamine diphosphatase LpxI [Phycisphaerales bacterium]